MPARVEWSVAQLQLKRDLAGEPESLLNLDKPGSALICGAQQIFERTGKQDAACPVG